jgi:hypothetical protein
MHRSGWLAARRDGFADLDASEGAQADRRDMARMFKVAEHRRECHTTGHRVTERCDRCASECVAERHRREASVYGTYVARVTECDCEFPQRPTCGACRTVPCEREGCLNRCQECGDDRMAGWDRRRWALDREADALLEGRVPAPVSAPKAPADDADATLLLVLVLLALA